MYPIHLEPTSFEQPKEITLDRRSSLEDRTTALHQIYQQVLERQPYQFERQKLKREEQEFLQGKLGVRRFLRILGHSSVYLDSFYYNATNLKFIEWSFKHFLGRAPLSEEEIRFYSDLLMTEGVLKVIDAFLDCEEYRKAFGCYTVPHPRLCPFHESAAAYLHQQILIHEHIGQRGQMVPTMYWQKLDLNCDGGTCRPAYLDAALDAAPAALSAPTFTAPGQPATPVTVLRSPTRSWHQRNQRAGV